MEDKIKAEVPVNINEDASERDQNQQQKSPKTDEKVVEIDRKTADEIDKKFGHLDEHVGIGGQRSS